MAHEPEHLTVALGERSYDIVIGDALLGRAADYIAPLLPSPKVMIISDEQVAAHYMAPLQAGLNKASIASQPIIVPAGEASKSFARFEWLMDALLTLQPDRKTTLIALGGGVVGDLCGFAASVLLRGVPFIQVPTSLLAQVDSSVGGKTGINTQAGKNLVGSFYQPQLVLIDTDTLRTLPARELRAGYAEVVKYGLIDDAPFFNWLEAEGDQVLGGSEPAMAKAIYTSCASKARIVAADEREGGVRALLNLGHTFGHALEAECGYGGELVHGEAVAIGMMMACRLSEKMGQLSADVTQRVEALLGHSGLPVSPRDVRASWDAVALCKHLYADKKTESGALTFITLRGIGQAVVSKNVDVALARAVIEESIA